MINLKDEVEFISIPLLSDENEKITYSAYYPIVMFDGEYDSKLGMTCGESIRLEPLPTMDEALEAAKAVCLSTFNAIGFTARGVEEIMVSMQSNRLSPRLKSGERALFDSKEQPKLDCCVLTSEGNEFRIDIYNGNQTNVVASEVARFMKRTKVEFNNCINLI